MSQDFFSFFPWLVAVIALAISVFLWSRLSRRGTDRDLLSRIYVLLERDAAERGSESEFHRSALIETERVLSSRLEQQRSDMSDRLAGLSHRLGQELAETRLAQAQMLRDMMRENAEQLAQIRASVSEQLHVTVEKQMQTSFQRVVEQFSAMQKAIGEVSAVTAQIGDLKRLFGNVKTRGGWGEAQLRAILDDILPAESYDSNYRIGDGGEVVEFALRMPVRSATPPRLAIDSKFPTEAYERLIDAVDRADQAAERIARRALDNAVRLEARKIAEKYIHPPLTVEFAVLYLPTDGLYMEVARIPGLIDEVGRVHRVIIMGPSLIPALLRTVHLGYVTLALEERTDAIARLLGLTRQEMLRMDGVLEKLSRGAGAMSNTIDEARRRTRVLGRKLRGLDGQGPGDDLETLDEL
ncbi:MULTISPECIES: DNA recombination protein RmuC [Asaia]|uniref:DNA recombination protein RmuC homolog n=1 Tax=Asaia bogorensis TaxID=91915 RepID=A0A060QGR2_9PROT|nr:DNA recombination protein RmuC [Asaia bogorensis NBRC 16594]CDG40115.1 DNA recombination protein RmuC [Asaia bogorensis]